MEGRRVLALTTMSLRHLEVRAGVDVGVADADAARDDGHRRLVTHAADQVGAATRDHEVDRLVGAQHRADLGAVGGLDELDDTCGQPGCLAPRATISQAPPRWRARP